ncbi:unnamed protein product [Amaranthus hypochondriacus]
MALCTTIALSVAQNLLTTLESLELRNISYFLCYKSKLNALQQSVKIVKDILLNVEGKETEANETQLNGIQLLKDAIYDTDDLIDEFLIVVELKQNMSNEGQKLSQKVLYPLYSRLNLITAYKLSREVKKLREKLDVISNNHSLHNFRVGNQLSNLHKQNIIKRKDTYFVNEGIVIGREEDQEKIVSVLIDSDIKTDNVSFISIVGMGGIGKTTLARLVYNDERVISAFSLRLWARAFNNEHGQLGVEIIDFDSMERIGGYKYKRRGLFKEEEKNGLGELLAGRKCLLILDDPLIKNIHHWRELVGILSKGCKGSWILVTTRLHELVRVIEGGMLHKLEGLSENNSWELFKMMAFGSKQINPLDDELVPFGNEIVKKCVGVPLAIRVVGSLLYGKDKSDWLSLHHIASSISREIQKDILPILKLSYDKLESPLKICFTYCALFPKDYVINKEVLKSLWMAQGYIVAFDNEGQTIKDTAEEYFSILLRRCFFQDVEYDECGGILSCKIHNLIHDIAQRVVGNEICVSNLVIDVDHKKVRHLSCAGELKDYSFIHNHARSFLCFDILFEDVNHFLQSRSWMWLRALKLSSIKTLCESIGDLIHLRYLDLSSNAELEELPLSIIKLYNLQTLKLGECRRLRKLPNNLNKLKKLRVLDIEGCNELNSMPRGIDKLTSLHTLSTFVVSEINQLNELKELNNLKGKLLIKFVQNYVEVQKDDKHEGDYLKNKKHLNCIFIEYVEKNYLGEIGVLGKMQPHPNLKVLEIDGENLTMPSWVTGYKFELLPNFIKLKLEWPWWENNLMTFLPNLIRLRLFRLKIEKSNYIAHLGFLPHLKELTIDSLINLKYILQSSPIAVNTNVKPCPLLYPSLEKLQLTEVHTFQGWRWGSGVIGRDNNEINIDGTKVSPLRLCVLKELTIRSSPALNAIIQCPVLEKLTLHETNRNFQVMIVTKEVGDEKEMTNNDPKPKLKKARIALDLLACVNVPTLTFHVLAYLEISDDKFFRPKVQSLKEFEDVFRGCSSSLQYFSISNCMYLKSIVYGGLEHLTVLKELRIFACMNWNVNEGESEDGTLWKPPFHYSLFHLTLKFLYQMVELPKWIQFLTSLQTLKIQQCETLHSLPKWMSKLTSLKILNLWQCSEYLYGRCQKSIGEDWPLIQHIPFIVFDRE